MGAQPARLTGALDRTRDPLHIAVVLDGVVLGQVFDAEAAAQVEDLELPARLRLHVRHEAEHHLGGVLERLDVKDLRADVAVDALEADPLHADGLPDRLHRLARLEREALVAHVLERDDLPHDVLLGELLAGDVLVVVVVGAVAALVDAVVGEVEGGKHDDAVAVVFLLDVHRERVDFFYVGGVFTFEQHRRLAVGEALQRRGLLQDLIDEGEIRLVLFGVRERLPDLSVVDEFGSDLRLRIVHFHSTFLTAVFFPDRGSYFPARRARP